MTAQLRLFAADDADWLTRQHGALYARDEGFDASFETLVGEILNDFLRTHNPARERGWIAEQGDQRLGSIFCVDSGVPETAKLRLFLLLPEARGKGLGQRLLDTCLDFARATGYRHLTLWTHESHKAACALYARNGFVLTNSFPTHSFGVDVVEQRWDISL